MDDTKERIQIVDEHWQMFEDISQNESYINLRTHADDLGRTMKAAFAKELVGQTPPFLLAGLLYAGSGIGLILIRLVTEQLMSVFDTINQKYGWHTIRLAAEGYSKPWEMRAEMKSPALV